MTWALASEPPRSDHISPIPVTRVVRGKKSSLLVSYRSPLANGCSPKSKFYFTKRTSSPLANNSSRRTIVHPIQNMLFGELKFAIGERSSRRISSRRTLVRGGWISSRERNFWRTVRQFAAEYGRIRANPGELRRTFGVLRRTFAGVRRSVGVGEPMANSREVRASSLEFARVRASSRRTTVRRVYCLILQKFDTVFSFDISNELCIICKAKTFAEVNGVEEVVYVEHKQDWPIRYLEVLHS